MPTAGRPPAVDVCALAPYSPGRQRLMATLVPPADPAHHRVGQRWTRQRMPGRWGPVRATVGGTGAEPPGFLTPVQGTSGCAENARQGGEVSIIRTRRRPPPGGLAGWTQWKHAPGPGRVEGQAASQTSCFPAHRWTVGVQPHQGRLAAHGLPRADCPQPASSRALSTWTCAGRPRSFRHSPRNHGPAGKAGWFPACRFGLTWRRAGARR
jgi:hypothetical protein